MPLVEAMVRPAVNAGWSGKSCSATRPSTTHLSFSIVLLTQRSQSLGPRCISLVSSDASPSSSSTAPGRSAAIVSTLGVGTVRLTRALNW